MPQLERIECQCRLHKHCRNYHLHYLTAAVVFGVIGLLIMWAELMGTGTVVSIVSIICFGLADA